MAITFTKNKQVLADIASALSAEASENGLSSLSTSLSEFSAEISGNSPTEREFFGGSIVELTGPDGDIPVTTDRDPVGLVWANTLLSAGKVIENKILNQIKTDTTLIESHMHTMQEDISRIRDLGDRNRDGYGFRVTYPYHEFSIAALWLLYIEQGKILDLDLNESVINDLLSQDQTGNQAVINASLSRLNSILSRIRTNFGTGFE